jgi:hypothetical protein
LGLALTWISTSCISTINNIFIDFRQVGYLKTIRSILPIARHSGSGSASMRQRLARWTAA